jgi:hypothetical protein
VLSVVALLVAVASDARLVCNAAERLVTVEPDTGVSRPVEPQPPAAAVALGAAGDTLVAVSASGQIAQLREGRWHEVTRLGGDGVQPTPLRIDSRYPQWATIWLRGNDPGTIPGAVGVSAKGETRRYNLRDARKMGMPFRAAPRALGEADPGVLPALQRRSGGGAPPELVLNEPSPWGGRLVALAQPAEGDLPSGALVHVSADGKVRELKLDRRRLDFKGAVGYGPGQLLFIDGAAAGVGRRVLLASADGRVRAVPGVEPPCTWWPAR